MAADGFFGPPPPGGWSQCGSLWAMGVVGALGLASMARRRRATQGRSGSSSRLTRSEIERWVEKGREAAPEWRPSVSRQEAHAWARYRRSKFNENDLDYWYFTGLMEGLIALRSRGSVARGGPARDERAAAERWFARLPRHLKEELGDQLAWGSFDWREWGLGEVPSRRFMAALDEARIHWEIEQI